MRNLLRGLPQFVALAVKACFRCLQLRVCGRDLRVSALFVLLAHLHEKPRPTYASIRQHTSAYVSIRLKWLICMRRCAPHSLYTCALLSCSNTRFCSTATCSRNCGTDAPVIETEVSRSQSAFSPPPPMQLKIAALAADHEPSSVYSVQLVLSCSPAHTSAYVSIRQRILGTADHEPASVYSVQLVRSCSPVSWRSPAACVSIRQRILSTASAFVLARLLSARLLQHHHI